MKLLTPSAGVAYPMRLLRSYDELAFTLTLDRRTVKAGTKIVCQAPEAIHLGVPRAKVMQPSDFPHPYLDRCELTIMVDGECLMRGAPLLAKHARLDYLERPNPFCQAIDQDAPAGIFSPNGTYVEVILKAPPGEQPMGAPVIRVSLDAKLYRALQV